VDFPAGAFEARLLRRPNRYLAFCEAPDGAELRCFCPDPGRLVELATPGRRALVAPAATEGRRTTHTLLALHQAGEWVSLLTAAANRLAREAAAAGLLPELPPPATWRAEVRHGESRLDFDAGGVLLEVKSVTLVVDGEARFPDAPTLRGARHVRELAAHAREGGRAMLLFVQQREAGRLVRPHAATDPAFAAALAEAAGAGVLLAAVACRVDTRGVTPARRIPVAVAHS
jgi:sugar fermentation stimulation protein A